MEGCKEVCLSKADVEHSLMGPYEHDESQEDPRDEDMSVESLCARDVAETQDVQTSLSTLSGRIDREQYWPGNASTCKGDDEKNFEEAEEEVAIEGVVVEDESVRFRSKSWDPAKGSCFVVVYSVAIRVLVEIRPYCRLAYCSTGMMLFWPRAL